jgi:opacity protein-like surface antigen
MKRSSSLKYLPIICSLAFFLWQKDALTQNWSVGVQAGEFLSTLNGDVQSDFRLGFVAGINASHYLTKNLVLRLELNVERKSTRIEDPTPDIPDNDFITEYDLDYLSLPLLLRYTASKNKVRVVAGGGVSFDYLLNERTQFSQNSRDDTDQFRRIDLDLVACAGAGIPLGEKFTLTLELRSAYGLVKVNKPSGLANELGRNFSWGLLAGVNYYL